MPDAITFGGLSRGCRPPHDVEAELAEPEPVEPVFAEPINAVRARVQTQVGKVRFERDLANCLETIRRLLPEDNGRNLRGATFGLAGVEKLQFRSAFEKRRLRILNSLYLAASKLSARPGIGDPAARKLYLHVGAATVSFQLDHPEAKPDRYGNWKTREGFADLLQLSIDGPGGRKFADAEETSLEAELTDIVRRTA